MKNYVKSCFGSLSNKAEGRVYGTPNFGIISSRNSPRYTHIEIAYLAKQVYFAYSANVKELNENREYLYKAVEATFELCRHTSSIDKYHAARVLRKLNVPEKSLYDFLEKGLEDIKAGKEVDAEKLTSLLPVFCEYKSEHFCELDEGNLNYLMRPYFDTFVRIIELAMLRSDLFYEQFRYKEAITTPECDRLEVPAV